MFIILTRDEKLSYEKLSLDTVQAQFLKPYDGSDSAVCPGMAPASLNRVEFTVETWQEKDTCDLSLLFVLPQL